MKRYLLLGRHVDKLTCIPTKKRFSFKKGKIKSLVLQEGKVEMFLLKGSPSFQYLAEVVVQEEGEKFIEKWLGDMDVKFIDNDFKVERA